MRTEMLKGLSTNNSTNWASIADVDIDTSWLDFGDVFDGILEGLGDLFLGIFEGL